MSGDGSPMTVTEARQAPPRILLVEDDNELRELLCRRFARAGVPITSAESGEEALGKIERAAFDVALFDLHLPGMNGLELLARFKELQPDAEVLLLTAHGSIETAIRAMKEGAYDYLRKPFQLPELEVHVQKAYEKVLLARRQRQWLEQLRYESPRYRLIGSSPAMRRVVQLIEKVAPTDATVLVHGPSGTGKELVARAIHGNSPRRDRPMVTINCASLQETLLESELFGHEKGAFTGAIQTKPGLIEVAEGGTLFIDEVAEMAPNLQAKLLRVLEDGRFRRVGGTQELVADVRVVAATNKSLEEEQRSGRFREDLFYRLHVIAICLPALKDRREDIPELVEHFLTTRPIGRGHCRVSPEAMEALKRYEWPGNIRELANVLERAQILAEDGVITPDDLPEGLVGVAAGPDDPAPDSRRLRDIERRHVVEILRQEKGNKVQTARALGISRRALYRLIAKYHLESPRIA
jgi:DNA-binding NtrC family response regulator